MSDIVVECGTQARPAPPPKRWRNVYWLAKRIELRESEYHAEGKYGPGRFASRKLWPSREVAEAKGLRSVERHRDRKHIIYLGPEEA